MNETTERPKTGMRENDDLPNPAKGYGSRTERIKAWMAR